MTRLGVSLLLSVLFASIAWITARYLTREELADWLFETWRFVKQIFPLLVGGVFAVGVIRVIIRPEWIETLAGQNTILGNMAGVLFGVFMYFPTLVEVPIAQMFLSLGMHRGPLLAYLMADPELSLQSILIISTIIGRVKAWTYVGWVALFRSKPRDLADTTARDYLERIQSLTGVPIDFVSVGTKRDQIIQV